MTEALSSQIAFVVPYAVQVDARGSQIALVAIVNEIPPPANGVNASQIALVSVEQEYDIAITYQDNAIRAIWGFPYYVERKPG